MGVNKGRRFVAGGGGGGCLINGNKGRKCVTRILLDSSSISYFSLLLVLILVIISDQGEYFATIQQNFIEFLSRHKLCQLDVTGRTYLLIITFPFSALLLFDVHKFDYMSAPPILSHYVAH